MSALISIHSASRSQRDAEVEDALAQKNASEFSRLLEARRETVARTAVIQAEAGHCLSNGHSQPSEQLEGNHRLTGPLNASRTGQGNDSSNQQRQSKDTTGSNDEQRKGDSDADTEVATKTQRACQHRESAMELTTQHSANRTEEVCGIPVCADDRERAAENIVTTNNAVENQRVSFESLAKSAQERNQAEESDEDNAHCETPTLAPIYDDKAVLQQANTDTSSIASKRHGLATREAITELVRLISNRIEGEQDDLDAPGANIWRFSLLDDEDNDSLTLVVTRNASDALSLTLDDPGRAYRASLLNELVARLAVLDDRIVVEKPYG